MKFVIVYPADVAIFVIVALAGVIPPLSVIEQAPHSELLPPPYPIRLKKLIPQIDLGAQILLWIALILELIIPHQDQD